MSVGDQLPNVRGDWRNAKLEGRALRYGTIDEIEQLLKWLRVG